AIGAEHRADIDPQGGAGLFDGQQREFFPQRHFLRAVGALLEMVLELIVGVVTQISFEVIGQEFCHSLTVHCRHPLQRTSSALPNSFAFHLRRQPVLETPPAGRAARGGRAPSRLPLRNRADARSPHTSAPGSGSGSEPPAFPPATASARDGATPPPGFAARDPRAGPWAPWLPNTPHRDAACERHRAVHFARYGTSRSGTVCRDGSSGCISGCAETLPAPGLRSRRDSRST